MPTLLAGQLAYAVNNDAKPPLVTVIPPAIQGSQLQNLSPSANHASVDKNEIEGQDDNEGHITSVLPRRAKFEAAGMMLSMWEAAEAGNLSSLIYHIRNHYQQGGNDKKLKELLNARNPSTEYTLLHTVFSEQNRNKNIHPILKLLLEHGADVSTPNVYNIYPIHAVCMHYPDPYVYLELLLNFKAKLNVRDGDGWTPLHYAARFSVPPGPPMKLLIERGANINSTCGSHKTPLFSLIANGDYPKTLDWLIHTARADLTIRGECLFNLPPAPKTQVGTVLLQVVKFGRIECLSLLLHSPVAMAQLCRAVDENELQYAQHIARLHSEKKSSDLVRVRRKDSTDSLEESSSFTYKHILHMLKELETLLMDDPTSLIGRKKKDLQRANDKNATRKKYAFSYTTHSSSHTKDDSRNTQEKLKRTNSSLSRIKDVLQFKKKTSEEEPIVSTLQQQSPATAQSLSKSSVSHLLFKADRDTILESTFA